MRCPMCDEANLPMTTKSFVVSGSGEFPVDMLRHDCCWPETTDGANKIALRYGACDIDLLRRRSIKLNTASVYSPHTARWASFGWKVTLS